MTEHPCMSRPRFSKLHSSFLAQSSRWRKETTKRGEKRGNRRGADQFHGWKAQVEPLIVPTKRLDSDHRPIQNPSTDACPTLPAQHLLNPSLPSCPEMCQPPPPFFILRIPEYLSHSAYSSHVFIAAFFPVSAADVPGC